MASQAVKQWEKVIALLKQTASNAPPQRHSEETPFQAACLLLTRIYNCEQAPPRAVWKKLLQAKVPLELCRVCCQLACTAQKSSRNGLALRAVTVLLEAAANSGVKPANSNPSTVFATSNSSSSGSSGSSSGSDGHLLALLRQQLLESQFLALLPRVVAETAAKLCAAAPQEGEQRAASGTPLSVSCEMAATDVADTLLQLDAMWPQYITSTTAHGGPLPVVDLLAATLQYLSSCMQAQGQGFEATSVQRQLLLRVCCTTQPFMQRGVLWAVHDTFDETEGQQALQHPSFVPCLCFNMAVLLLAPIVQQQQQHLQANSSDGSSGSGSTTAPAWLLQQADKVPEPVMQLLRLVGCQHPALALAAADSLKFGFQRPGADKALLRASVCAIQHLANFVWGHPEHQLSDEVQLQLGWLAAALLDWATAQVSTSSSSSSSSSSSDYAQVAWVGCVGARHALSCLLNFDKRQTAPCTFSSAMPDSVLCLLSRLLPDLLQAWRAQLQQQQQQQQEAVAAVTAGATSSGSSSSGPASSGSSSSPDSMQAIAVAIGDAADVLIWLVRQDLRLLPPLTLSAVTVSRLFAVVEDVARMAVTAAPMDATGAGRSVYVPGDGGAPASVAFYVGTFDTLLTPADLGGVKNTSLLGIWEQAEGSVAADASPSALPMFGVLCSMLKVNSSNNSLGTIKLEHQGLPLGLVWCRAVCGAATALLAFQPTALRRTTSPAATGSEASTATASTATAGGQQQDVGALPPAATHASTRGLPWVVVLGRCCLQLSAFLRVVPQPAQDGEAVAASAAPAAGAALSLTAAQRVQVVAEWEGAVHGLRLAVGIWAERDSIAEQLTAWGYADVRERLLAQLQELAAAHAAAVAAVEAPAAAETGGDTAAAAAIASYSDQLHAVGLSLTAFATPLACNNPGCGNVAGPSEAELVGGRSCVCGGCLVARYCSRACQRVHWKQQHKPVCKALAAAAAAAAGGAGEAAAAAGESTTA